MVAGCTYTYEGTGVGGLRVEFEFLTIGEEFVPTLYEPGTFLILSGLPRSPTLHS